MNILKQGDKGAAVETLQTKLSKLGYYDGRLDGDYGPKTKAAVLAFQLDYTDVDDDGKAGPQTLAKIEQALRAMTAPPTPASTPAITPCNDATWAEFQKLVKLVTTTPVRYGPGRGLWSGGKFVITHGPGALGSKTWKNFLGKSYPSFHCTSWTNFFLGWLLRRNELYTHAGTIPDLFDLLSKGPEEHVEPQDGWTLRYRGYGDACSKIAPDGSGAKRHGVSNVVDARELFERRTALPTFIVCGQSTKQASGWKWWHHTVLFVARGGSLYRIAADGYRDASRGYSAQPMPWTEITEKNLAAYASAVYRPYGVNTTTGAYGDPSKPIATVTLEP